ncbi:hypothetical protein BBB39_15255 [Bordetella trematum]|uniref:Uncharacterized protein n=1 Tax=Bordetella trematum TaxID=123899 RepID=A0A157NWL3_9BORD|nr:sialidase family protein [Bordetella trematum]AZR93938.1 hypothetical protein BBB39_09255 [Bordetella trematum]AZR94964.1 hypothetical protein BBB39_15255 [Bordetella trematum]NNH21480.1 exo-alpha-sialidase [Bordetella trematum]SAI25456.1 Uncharacterised protein [Bordetella trematum]SAI66163.1 Uncharacterised protein [Bordetella trematum]
MPVVIGIKREFEYTGNDLRGRPCLFPREVRNHVMAQALNFRTKLIDSRADRYLAFPQAQLLKGSIVGIYSDGVGHADSDRQVMFRSDDYGESFRTTPFAVKNPQGGGYLYDFSLIEDLVSAGESVALKVFTITNDGGTLRPTVVSQIQAEGLTYSTWGRVTRGSDGKYYRTAYASLSPAQQQPAVFESSDMITWIFKSVIMSLPGRLLNECAIVETSPGSWLALCREDSGANNPIYWARSTSNMGISGWSAAQAYPTNLVQGRQPDLIKLSDGSLLLATGDRSGTSGYGGSAGDQVTSFSTTGITVFRTTDMSGATWGYRTRIAPIYSTDGGQPSPVEISPGRVFMPFYARRSTKALPAIGSATFDTAPL